MQLITGGQISACVPQIGQATVAVNGGTPGYQYVWNTNPIQTTSTALGLGAGTWQIKVIDSRGCEDSTNVVLTTPPALQLNTTSTDVQCFGQSNGSASGLGQGGTPPYQYVWNTTPIQTTASITGLPAGQYSIIVYDVFGCTDTAVITIREPSLLQATTTYVSPSCHGGSNGQASVSATGGVMPYSYQWLGGQTTSTILGCSATSYEVRVTDASGCTVDQTVQVTEPSLLQLTMQSSPLTCIQPPNNGTGNVTAQGGTAPYSYQWSGGSSPTNAYNTGLGAGTWSVQVTDNQGCMASGSVVLIAPTYPTITGGTDTFFCKGIGGVMITAQGFGGVLPYTYVWSPNNGSLSNANVQNPLANPDSITCYQVEVIDAAGCRSIIPANVCVTPYEVPLVNAGTDEDYCKDGAAVFISGFIQNPIAGGYDWQWTPSLGLYCDTCPTTYANPNVTTIYTLRATHKLSGCSSDSSTLNSVSAMVVTVKPRPIVYAGMDTVICPIDSAQLWATATGAGPQYSYEWSPSFGLNDSTLQFPKASPTHSVQYYLVATSEGCESLADSVLVSISPVPTVEAGNVKNVCLGDSVQLDGQSQLGFNAQVIWSPAQGLSDTTMLQPMASPINSRWYYLQAQQGGCKGLPDSVYVVAHPVPQAYAGQDTVICGDSTKITLQGSYTGGGSPIRINWSPGLNAPQNQQLQPIVMPGQTNWYYLQVSSGIPPTQCSTLDSVLITVLPSINLITTQDTGLICVGDSITLVASGGSGAAVFQWSPLSGLSSMVNDNSKVKVSPATSTTYILQASEGGCLEADTFRVQVHPPISAAFIMSQTKVCVPESEVAFENRSLGAVSISWDFGDNTGLSNETNPLHPYKTPGSYAVRLVAIGVGGCKDTVYSPTKVEVYEGFQPMVSTTPALPLEVTAPGGKVVASETSGQAQQWTWYWGDGTQSNGSIAEHQYNQAGTYKIELYAEDKQGCRGRWESSPIVVQVPEVFIPNVFSPNGDGIGDGFRVEYTGDEYFNLKILDRWGVLLFETHNPQQYWEGKDRNGGEVGAGVYYYQFRIGEKNYPPGNVTLLR
jgi:gliding motility-associated-like protein